MKQYESFILNLPSRIQDVWLTLLVRHCQSKTLRKGVQGFPISLLACALSFEEPFRLSSSGINDLDIGESILFLQTGFRGRYCVESRHDLHNSIHWQIRYFSPPHTYGLDMMECLLSKRQTAILQHGSRNIILHEQRAVVSFRVLREDPELFSILVLKDEDISPEVQSHDQQFDVDTLWKGYGFLEPNEVTPLTHYLLEICRVFKMCMGAWGETLSAIDILVHVEVN